jgi:hypothetical protein
MPDLQPPAECANCGAPIPRRAKACPECGADEKTGWREGSIYDGLDLPDTAWADENEANARPRRRSRHVNDVPWFWWAVGAGLIVLLVVVLLGL